jgi:hypothetical protein
MSSVNELKASNLISLEEGEEDEILLLYPHQLCSGQRNVNGRRNSLIIKEVII